MFNVGIIFTSLLMRLLGRLTADMYIIALPLLAIAFDSSQVIMQLSVSVYFIGLFISALISGPVADYIGKEKTLLGSLMIFTIGTVLVLLIHNEYALITGRFI